jgi:hypothetical protein
LYDNLQNSRFKENADVVFSSMNEFMKAIRTNTTFIVDTEIAGNFCREVELKTDTVSLGTRLATESRPATRTGMKLMRE